MVNGGTTVREYSRFTVCPPLRTWSVKPKVPVVVGVPLSTPAALRLSPAGRLLPACVAHE